MQFYTPTGVWGAQAPHVLGLASCGRSVWFQLLARMRPRSQASTAGALSSSGPCWTSLGSGEG